MSGIRWSLISSASSSPRLLSSFAVVRASGPEAALITVYWSRYFVRRSRRTAASTCGSSSTTRRTGLLMGSDSGRSGQREVHAEFGPPGPRVDFDHGAVVPHQAV